MPDTVELRGHHLLCMLTFVGEGYTPAFSQNFAALVGRINAGAPLALVEGPDAICAALQGENGPLCESGEHCHLEKTRGRDALAREAAGNALGRNLTPGAAFNLAPADCAKLRASFTTGNIRAACAGCEWRELCTNIAKDGFAGALLFPDAVP